MYINDIIFYFSFISYSITNALMVLEPNWLLSFMKSNPDLARNEKDDEEEHDDDDDEEEEEEEEEEKATLAARRSQKAAALTMVVTSTTLWLATRPTT